MYYLNQVPPQTPPTRLGPGTPVHWSRVSSGHQYGWHDGRLHALASVALAPGATYVGRWTIPLRVDGAPATIAGGLFHAANPSLVWFWPILVVLACVFAALRLGRPELDLRLARGLGLVALVAFLVVGAGQQLHGRPTVSVGQLIVFAAIVAFGAWALRRLALRRHGWFTFFLIAVAAIWEGASSITVLLDGYVLLALPALRGPRRGGRLPGGGRRSAAAGLPDGRAAGARLTVAGASVRGRGPRRARLGRRARVGRRRLALAAAGALVVTAAGCGSQHSSATGTAGIPPALLHEARPIGRGPQFHPPATGSVIGPCRRHRGPRDGVHVEVFAANRVVLLAAGIGVAPSVRSHRGPDRPGRLLRRSGDAGAHRGRAAASREPPDPGRPCFGRGASL